MVTCYPCAMIDTELNTLETVKIAGIFWQTIDIALKVLEFILALRLRP